MRGQLNEVWRVAFALAATIAVGLATYLLIRYLMAAFS
jgi:hypothetical protein